MPTTVLDRLIGWWNPEAGVRRVAAREALTMARSYEAGKSSRRTEGWSRRNPGPNAAVADGGGAAMRARVRDLVRNDPHAAAAVTRLAAHIAGTGIVPRLVGGSTEARRRFQELWQPFHDQCDVDGQQDFSGLQTLVARQLVESGEALIRLWPREPGAVDGRGRRLVVPLQLEVIESDLLDTSRTEALANGGAVIQGVEVDATGRRVAYWLYDRHPAENVLQRGTYAVRRWPAERVLHVFDRQRPGQMRGVSWLAPVALLLRDLADLDESELTRKRIAALFAVFVRQPGGVQDRATLTNDARSVDGQSTRVESLYPGAVKYLAPGEDVTLSQPPASEGYAEFHQAKLRAVAAGLGLAEHQLTGDLSRANYSSLREGKLEFWQQLDRWQWGILIPQLCRPVWGEVETTLRLSGTTVPAGRVEWTTPRRPWVDPAKEADALLVQIKAGLRTWSDAVTELGYDPEDQMAEIAADRDRAASFGLDLDAMLERPAVMVAGAEPGRSES